MLTIPGRKLGSLAAVAVLLAVAFVLAPPTLAGARSSAGIGDERDLTEALRAAFVEYWHSGAPAFSPRLEQVVDYWFRYHVVKAGIAALLLVVLVALGVLLRQAYQRADAIGRRGRAALASAGALVTALGLLALVTVMANVQGAVAPFASLLPMLTGNTADAELTGTLDQVRQRIAAAPAPGGRTPPALAVMIDDFARYHVAMALIAAIVAASLVVLSVAAWRRFSRATAADRATRRSRASFGVLTAVTSLILMVIALANTATAADPAPALAAFFAGGW
ncbi:hypothetical protein [Actinoplanes sp. NPDC049599]|uniref:hypothetical protein n=1 Tax=Actinoplanes sp. NPDC049599 TaxID=3363903 RepID=UPI00379FA4D5